MSLEGGDLGELGFLGGRDWARRERRPEGRSLKVPLGVVRDQSDCWAQDYRPGNQAGKAGVGPGREDLGKRVKEFAR